VTAKEALDAGLVDEIVEVPPSMRPSEVALPAPISTPGLTDEEQFVQDMLVGCGMVKVRDKAAFGQRMTEWFSSNTREI
jgi:hypothetical protein